ncbi:uncharacterized protein [Blastocystis hominis]|uniref:Uncharacterized protein n=1 Tax=Blastocystis hominis TaxID=12968 RepID=D8LYK8_BLAHO|nr:uncharacterized protein [Blastocystis hominis]CBK20663.2 unnamed protein product [Blastocystis hominis]|eukprot:XP_012894711.1 uncharacterized protein [Blastocystis hominis]
MSEKESVILNPKSVTAGQFEFTSIRLPTSEGQYVSPYAKEHVVLQSIELQAERGSIPLLARCEDSHLEDIRLEEAPYSSSSEVRDQFLAQLDEITTTNMPQIERITPPKSLAELSQFRKIGQTQKESPEPRTVEISDDTTLQLLDTITSLPSDFKHDLLNYLKVVEEKYSELEQKEAQLRQPN